MVTAAQASSLLKLDSVAVRQRLEVHLLVDLQLRGSCLLDIRNVYWTAKLCPRVGVSQYHVPDVPGNAGDPPALFALGSYDAKATWVRATRPEIRFMTVQPSGLLHGKNRLPYVPEIYTNGDVCALSTREAARRKAYLGDMYPEGHVGSELETEVAGKKVAGGKGVFPIRTIDENGRRKRLF